MSSQSTTEPEVEALVVSPAQARKLLGISNTLLYAILGDKSLASYRCGRSRRIPMSAIRDYISRAVAANTGKRPRGRPRKIAAQPPSAAQPEAVSL